MVGTGSLGKDSGYDIRDTMLSHQYLQQNCSVFLDTAYVLLTYDIDDTQSLALVVTLE